MTLTDTTLAEIEAAARAATEGPWQTMAGDPLAIDAHSSVYVAKMTGATPVTELAANARFITLACNNAAAMVKEIVKLRSIVSKLLYQSQDQGIYPVYKDHYDVKEQLSPEEASLLTKTLKGTSDV